jgi:hypothetical protein
VKKAIQEKGVLGFLKSKEEIDNWDFFFAALAIVFTFIAIGFVYTAFVLQDQVPESSKLPLTCGECQYLVGSSCVDYECCENDNCWGTQQCVDHKCVPVTCPEGQKVLEHACVPTKQETNQTTTNQTVTNQTTTNQTVTGNETTPGIECEKNVDCLEIQECVANSCVNVSCEKGFTVRDHKCVPVKCSNNDDCNQTTVCINSECVKLTCGECQYADQHKCLDYECCQDSDCSISYYCADHSCVKRECEEDEYLAAGKCIAYVCTSDDDCNDKKTDTRDYCENPSTPEAECFNVWKQINFTASSSKKSLTLHVGQIAKSEIKETTVNVTDVWHQDVFLDVTLHDLHEDMKLAKGGRIKNYTVGKDTMHLELSSIAYSEQKATMNVWYTTS